MLNDDSFRSSRRIKRFLESDLGAYLISEGMKYPTSIIALPRAYTEALAVALYLQEKNRPLRVDTVERTKKLQFLDVFYTDTLAFLFASNKDEPMPEDPQERTVEQYLFDWYGSHAPEDRYFPAIHLVTIDDGIVQIGKKPEKGRYTEWDIEFPRELI